MQIESANPKKGERRVNSPALIVGDVDRRNLPFAVDKLRVAGSLIMDRTKKIHRRDFSWKAQPIKERDGLDQDTRY